MRLNNISFPYPVLRSGYDDILPHLPEDSIYISYTETATDYTFEITLKYNNPDIEKLVKEGKAIHTCEIDCIKTVWRESCQSKSPTFSITIPRRNIAGNINFSSFVSVIQPIKGYTNSGFNSDYGGAKFDMEPGDILVGFPVVPHHIDIKYDKLQAPGSFIIIREDIDAVTTNYCFDSDKIEIILPSEMFKQYQNGLKSNFAEIMHSSIAFNALTCALYELPDCHDTLLWVQALKHRLEQEAPDYYDPDTGKVRNVPYVANQFLRDPYKRLFNKLTEQIDNDIE